MASKSYYLSTSLLDYLLRGVSFSAPAGTYLALFTSAPTSSGGGVEVSGGAYARQSTTWQAANNGATTNAALVAFPAATAPWGTVVAYALFDAASGGHLLYYASLNAPRSIQVNDQMQFPAGQLVLTET